MAQEGDRKTCFWDSDPKHQAEAPPHVAETSHHTLKAHSGHLPPESPKFMAHLSGTTTKRVQDFDQIFG